MPVIEIELQKPGSAREEENRMNDAARDAAAKCGLSAEQRAAPVQDALKVSAAALGGLESPVLAATERYVSSPLITEAQSDATASASLRVLLTSVDSSLSRIATATQDQKVTTCALYLAAVFAIPVAVGSAVGTIDTIIRWAHSGSSGKGGSTLTPEQEQLIRTLVQSWLALSPLTFWGNMADYTDTNSPSIDTQMFFMQCTKLLAPLDRAWVWDSDADKLNLVNGLIDAYNKSGNPSAVYRQVALERYKDQELERYVAADLCEFVIPTFKTVEPAAR